MKYRYALSILFLILFLIPRINALGLVYDGPNPITLDLNKERGPFTITFSIENPSNDTEVVWLNVAGIGNNKSFIENWEVSFFPSNFTLAPSESKSIQMVATLKPNSPLGLYEASLLVSAWNPKNPYDKVDNQIVVRMFVIRVLILATPEFPNMELAIFTTIVLLATFYLKVKKK